MVITVTTYLLTATACAVVNTFVGRRASKKVQQAQLDYEKALRENSRVDAEAAYECLVKTRIEMANEEEEASKKLQQESHNEHIKLIADESSRESWPLFVLPMVMRNDELLHSKPNNLLDSSPALNVILAPFLEEGIQNAVYSDLQSSLLDFFNKWWTPMTEHPIVFYHDCWKDSKKNADPIMVNNLYAKLKGTPTIVINPVIHENGLRLDISHWSLVSVIGEDGNKEDASKKLLLQITIDNLPISVGRGLTYSKEESERLRKCLLKCLEIIISQYSDAYMWHRAKVAPNIFNVIKAGGLKVEDKERQWLHKSYSNMFQGSLKSGEVIMTQDTENILSFCKQTDIVLENISNGAFKVLVNALPNNNENKKECDNEKTDIENFALLGREQAKKCIDFCYEHKDLLGLNNDEICMTKHRWLEEILMDECVNRLETLNEYNQPYTPNDVYHYLGETVFGQKGDGKLYDNLFKELQAFSAKTTLDYLELSKKEPQYTDKRNFVRPKIKTAMNGWIDKKIKHLIYLALDNLNVFISNQTMAFVKNTAKNVQESIKMNGTIPVEVIMKVYGTIKNKMLNKLTKPQIDEWIQNNDSIIRSDSYAWADFTVKAWIKYKWFDPDEYYSYISISEKEKINNYLSNMLDRIIYIVKNYAEKATGEE